MKTQKRKEFFNYCKSVKDNDLRTHKAIEIWNSYKPEKLKKMENDQKDILENKHSLANKESGTTSVRNTSASSRLTYDFKQNDLYLSNPADIKTLFKTLSSFIISFIFLIIFILYSLIIMGVISIITGFVFTIILYISDTHRYYYIERDDFDNIRYINKTRRLITSFNAIIKNKDIRYKNGNLKTGKLRDEVNVWFRDNIIKVIKDPLRIDSESKPILSMDFPNVGGIYAWVYNQEIVYIGKANNINRRMKEHIEGLTKNGHSEYKYNAGVDINNLHIKVLAMTNDEDEQSVLESYYFDKYKNNKLLNSTGTLSWEKILTKQKYVIAWKNIQDRTNF